MKLKTTKKGIMSQANNVYYCGYCEIQSLLRYQSPIAYTSGNDGWNADVYLINGSNDCIVTGYRPFGTERIPHVFTEKYERNAQVILNNTRNLEDREFALNDLLYEMIKELQNS